MEVFHAIAQVGLETVKLGIKLARPAPPAAGNLGSDSDKQSVSACFLQLWRRRDLNTWETCLDNTAQFYLFCRHSEPRIVKFWC